MLARFIMGATSRESSLRFVGGASTSSSATQTPSFSLAGLSGGLASSPSSGDIVIACVSFKDATNRNIQCTTSGYTEVADLFANTNANVSQLGVYYKVLSAADTSVAFDIGVSVASYFAVQVWRGINSTPLDATTTTTTGGTARPNAPSITTVTSGAVVIAVGAGAGDSVQSLGNLTVPSGMGNFFQTTASTDASIGIASILRTATGAYDPPTFGGGNAISGVNNSCAATLALRPQ
jgi:hypothetical protein